MTVEELILSVLKPDGPGMTSREIYAAAGKIWAFTTVRVKMSGLVRAGKVRTQAFPYPGGFNGYSRPSLYWLVRQSSPAA